MTTPKNPPEGREIKAICPYCGNELIWDLGATSLNFNCLTCKRIISLLEVVEAANSPKN